MYTEDRMSNGVREGTSSYGDSIRNKTKCYTVTDYFGLPEEQRMELIDGVFYDMSAPSLVHQRIIGDIYLQISNYIKEKNGDCIPVISPIDVRLEKDEFTMVQPDLLIICNPDQMKDNEIDGAPDFVMEVVSHSSGTRDYVKKVAKYMSAGVREYWIVDPLKKRVMVYDFEGEGIPYIQGLEGSLGMKIYGEDLQISFEEIKKLV